MQLIVYVRAEAPVLVAVDVIHKAFWYRIM
jgi:hypothetical protein